MTEPLSPHWHVAAPDGGPPLTVRVGGEDTFIGVAEDGSLFARRGGRLLSARVAFGLVWIWLGPPNTTPTPLPDARSTRPGLFFPWCL